MKNNRGRIAALLLGVVLAFPAFFGASYAFDQVNDGFPRVGDGTLWGRSTGTTNTKQDVTVTSNALDINIKSGSPTAQGVAPGNSTALESSHVIKASAGNLFWLTVTSDTNAGFLMVFNATSAPGDGAVTPAYCVPIAASSGNPFNWLQFPVAFSTGITVVYSSTGCLTKTASVHATFYWGAL